MSIDRQSRSARRTAKREATVRAVAERELTDSRWDHLRTRRVRRGLVLAWLVTTALIAVAWPAGAIAWVGLPGIAAWIVAFTLLRRSVRSLADLPEEFLDERQIAVRDRVYLHAYRIFSLGVLLLLFALAVVVDRYGLAYESVSGAMWLAIGTSMGLPSAVLAWQTTDT